MNKCIKGGEIVYETLWRVKAVYDIDGLVQERRNSSALAMELRLSCTNPSILSYIWLCQESMIVSLHCCGYKCICKVDRICYDTKSIHMSIILNLVFKVWHPFMLFVATLIFHVIRSMYIFCMIQVDCLAETGLYVSFTFHLCRLCIHALDNNWC